MVLYYLSGDFIMKKLVIFFIVSLFTAGMFAETIELPQNSGYEDGIIYVDNAISNQYIIFSFTSENNETETFLGAERKTYPHHIDFYNISLSSKIYIFLEIHFADIKSMNDFINKYFANTDVSEIPNIFITLRQIISKKSGKAENVFDENTKEFAGIRYYYCWK